MKYTVWDLLNNTVNDARGNAKVLDYDENQKRKITFRQLRDDARHCASYLQKNIGQRKHIAMLAGTSYEWLVMYFGIAGSNNVSVLLDGRLPAQLLIELLEQSDASAVVYDSKTAPLIEAIKTEKRRKLQFFDLSDHSEDDVKLRDILAASVTDPDINLNEDEMCSIMTTSATTGRMKLVMLSHRNITATVECGATEADDYSDKDTFLLSLPLSHSFGIIMMLNSFFCGMNLALNRNPAKMMDDVRIYQANVLMTIPMVLEYIIKKMEVLRARGMDCEKVKQLVFQAPIRAIGCGGAPMNVELALKYFDYGIDIRMGYGLTEMSPLVCINYNYQKKPGSVGVPFKILQAKISEGELVLKGPNVMLGYYKNEAETKEVLKDGWLHTGDLARIDEDGYVYLTGRKKNLIILSNGENISPENIEEKFAEYDVIDAVMVYEGKDALCAAFVLKDKEQDKAEIERIVREVNMTLPQFSKIVRWQIREDDFPKNAMGKIVRLK